MRFRNRLDDRPHCEATVFRKLRSTTRPVVLFGTGSVTRFELPHLVSNGVHPVCFCDNDPEKQNTTYLGLPVYDYDTLKARFNGRYLILITAAEKSDIRNGLLARGEATENIVYFGGFRDPWSRKTDRRFVMKNLAAYEAVYHSLADALSQKTFVNLLNHKLTADMCFTDGIRAEAPYFDLAILDLTDTETFVDVGAFTGDTVDAFLNTTDGVYSSITALEPDWGNIEKLTAFVAASKQDNIHLSPVGAWDKEETLTFTPETTGSTGSVIPGAAHGYSIDLLPIDQLLNGTEATLIKMDIEGAERRALRGLEQTIQKWRPTVAVSLYHKREDMFQIPLLLKSFVSDYAFYVRNYTDIAGDTVLYAVSKSRT